MTETKAKKQLERMLVDFTPGTILHLLAQIFDEEAEQAGRDGDAVRHDQFRLVEHTLVVTGYGLDAACPRGSR